MAIRRLAGLLVASLLTGTAWADRSSSLRENARSLPDVRAEDVDPAVDAALAEETDRVPAELLIAIAWGESRLRPDVRTGHVCGIMQVNPTDLGLPRSRCRAWELDRRLAFRAGVSEIEMMLRDRRVRGNIRRALLYRACGNRAFDGTCAKTKWPGWVLRRAERLSYGS